MGNYKVLTLLPMAILILSGILVAPIPIFADPPVLPPIPGTIMPKVFCIKITDIRADKDDNDNNKFTFEFEVLNWSNRPATDVHFALAEPDSSGVRFVDDAGSVHDSKQSGDADISDGVDEDGRPLFTGLDGVGDPIPDEDSNGNGMLDEADNILKLLAKKPTDKKKWDDLESSVRTGILTDVISIGVKVALLQFIKYELIKEKDKDICCKIKKIVK